MQLLGQIYFSDVGDEAAWPVLPGGVTWTEQGPGGCKGLKITDGLSLPCNTRASRDREAQEKLENDQGSQINYSLTKLGK